MTHKKITREYIIKLLYPNMKSFWRSWILKNEDAKSGHIFKQVEDVYNLVKCVEKKETHYIKPIAKSQGLKKERA